MICALCNSEKINGVEGPDELFICNECIDTLNLENDLKTSETCSFCSTKIGKTKGIFKKHKYKAIAFNIKSGVVLCKDCGQLCIDIKNERTKTYTYWYRNQRTKT